MATVTDDLNTALPYGARDLKLTKYDDALGMVLGTASVDLPYLQHLNFTEAEEFTELRGDDKTITTRGKGSTVNWDIESGGLSSNAWAIFTGGSVIQVSAEQGKRVFELQKKSTTSRPWFRIDGKIVSDSGGDILVRIYRCRANADITSNFQDGEFATTAVTGVGYPLLDDANDLLYSIFHREQERAISLTPDPNPIPAPQNLTVGALTATTAAVSWTLVPQADEYKVEYAEDTGTPSYSAVTPNPTTGTATLTPLTADTDYVVRVSSVAGSGGTAKTSAPSLEVRFKTPVA